MSAPPSIQLALMAAQLATSRTTTICYRNGMWIGVCRASLEYWTHASTEYYAIIDRLTAGEKP